MILFLRCFFLEIIPFESSPYIFLSLIKSFYYHFWSRFKTILYWGYHIMICFWYKFWGTSLIFLLVRTTLRLRILLDWFVAVFNSNFLPIFFNNKNTSFFSNNNKFMLKISNNNWGLADNFKGKEREIEREQFNLLNWL